MDAHFAFARPRVGLLGNPSDLYGGRVVSFTVDAFETVVHVKPTTGGVRFADDRGTTAFEDWPHLLAELKPSEVHGGSKLTVAALDQLLRFAPQLRELAADDPRSAFEVTFRTDIPRQVGLSGSSAIVIAALRAWSYWFELEITPFELSEIALAAENVSLGMVAGPQDRVVQSYGGLVSMDFSGPRAPTSYKRMDPSLLPAMLVAWNADLGASSATVHHDVRERYEAGDPKVREVMAGFPGIVARGLIALEERDVVGLADALDANFSARASIFPISESNQRLIDAGRQRDAGVKFCGSGGAVLAVPRDPRRLDELEDGYREVGFRTLRPRVGPLEASFR
ncbi:MAG: hypothetical protein O2816_18680 [Planctomycetota bacterium]|nr:hypothetical protein [Planctomycetota bacterium]